MGVLLYREMVSGLLELRGLRRRYGPVTALDDLSFSVPAGQVVGFLGPNGAGKTTTMRADLRPHRPRRRDGHVERRAGRPGRAAPVRLHARRARSLPGHARRRAARVPRGLHGMSAHDARAATRTWLERLGVADRVGQQGGGALARQPAAGAAGRGAGARTRAARPRRAAGRTGPDGNRRHRRRARRAGPVGLLRALLQPPARPGRGSLRVGHDHRPRPPRGDRQRWTTWPPAARAAWSCGSRATGTPRGPAASPASRSPRSTAARHGLCSTPSVDSDVGAPGGHGRGPGDRVRLRAPPPVRGLPGGAG